MSTIIIRVGSETRASEMRRPASRRLDGAYFAVGLDHIHGFLSGGMAAWIEAGLEQAYSSDLRS